MTATDEDIRAAVLRVASTGKDNRRISGNALSIVISVENEFKSRESLSRNRIMAAIWDLIGQGLIYIDFMRTPTEYWEVRLTAHGQEALDDVEGSPSHPPAYLDRLKQRIPEVSDRVLQYADEAARAYVARCYLASAVMLGVAAEAAFLEMAEALVGWLPEDEGKRLSKTLEDPRASYQQKVSEFENRLTPKLKALPPSLASNFTSTLPAVLDLIRAVRNSAGHPTGTVVTRDRAHGNLLLFRELVSSVYALTRFFREDGAITSTPAPGSP